MAEFLPINQSDMNRRGWTQCDFVYVVGDAYVDHPSFGHAIISRVLEAHGYKVGDVVTVKIVKLMTFGAFAEIIPGVDGLIHISQIADRRIGKPEDVLSEGQEVDAKTIDIDQEHKRISLSIRALLAPADEDEE